MGLRNDLLMLMAGVFLTYAWPPSTSLFATLPFGVALMLAGALSLGPDIAVRIPNRRRAETFALPENVLPDRHHH